MRGKESGEDGATRRRSRAEQGEGEEKGRRKEKGEK